MPQSLAVHLCVVQDGSSACDTEFRDVPYCPADIKKKSMTSYYFNWVPVVAT